MKLNCSPPSRVGDGNEWGCTSTPPICHLDVDKGHFFYYLLFIFLRTWVPNENAPLHCQNSRGVRLEVFRSGD